MAKLRFGSSLQKWHKTEVHHSVLSGALDVSSLVMAASRIAEGACIQGELEFVGSLYFAGKLHGSIFAEKGSLDLSENGEIHGDVYCRIIDCHGQILGNIEAQEKSILRGNCRLAGDIATGVLSIQNGARVKGYCRMLKDTAVNMDFFSMPIENLRKHLQSQKLNK